MPFSDLGLMPDLLRAIVEKGYQAPTPIQRESIPAVLAGRDVLAGAQTGTGKTAGFILPILQMLSSTPHRKGIAPRALVLTPTRELAAQVADNARSYGRYLPIRTQVVFGGVNITPQIKALKNGCDLLVATPGRLLDLQQQRAADLSHVEVLVLDEADRMLDMGFIHDIKRLLKLLPGSRQNLLFSATCPDDIRNLAQRLLHDPVSIQVTPRNTAVEVVNQCAYRVPKEHKRHLLAHLIRTGDWHQVLVFTRTKHGANRLCQQLESAGIPTAAIHGNKSQAARVKALEGFKQGRVTALVATEVAARGLDIKELPVVVNHELPNVPEDYVHRIGRTGRAGAGGTAVSLISPDETPLLREIERLLNRSVPVQPTPAFPTPEPATIRPQSAHGGSRNHRHAAVASDHPASTKAAAARPTGHGNRPHGRRHHRAPARGSGFSRGS